MMLHVFYSDHTRARAVQVHHRARLPGEGGGERRCPAASAFPRGGLSASPPPWSLIIYRGDKIKQTQQNGAKPKRRSSHSHAWRAEGSRAGFVRLPVPASQHPSASSSQVETRY